MKYKKILIDHGSGGLLANSLVKELFLSNFNNSILNNLDDGGVFKIEKKNLAISTDSYVVDPIFFPGGSIGDLAVNGTVNDVCMCGAIPKFLTLSLVIEEGFSMIDLKKIIADITLASNKADVKIITGDTKVVPKGAVDKIFINTSGLGIVLDKIKVSSKFAEVGDVIILTGTIGDHATTILTQREGLSFNSNIKSDTASLNHMILKVLRETSNIHVLRDPTRGGVGTALNEIAIQSNVGIQIYENNIPIKKEVLGICNLLGFDPMYLANEGKALIFVPSCDAKKVLNILRKDEYGTYSCVIGDVIDDHYGKVFMKTLIGGERIVDMLIGEQLPRIC